jgi:hypothetical protein
MPFLPRHIMVQLPEGKKEYGIYHKDTKGKYSVFFPRVKKRVRTTTNRIYANELLAIGTCFEVPANLVYVNEYEG